MQRETLEFFEVFPWNKNLETGIDEIDAQHKKLVLLLNRLAAHLADKSNPLTIAEVLDDLTAYVAYHFESEESIWESCLQGDDILSSHQLTHQSFVSKVLSFCDADKMQSEEFLGELLGFLTHWLAYHILDSDRRMAKVVLGVRSGLDLASAKREADEAMSGATRILIDTVLGMYDSLSSRTLELLRERTERRRAEAALKASEDRWRFVLDGAGEGIWDWNVDSGQIYRSTDCPGILELLRVREGEEGKGEQIHPDDLLRVQDALMAHLAGRTDAFINEHRIVHPDGTWSWVLTRGKVTARDAKGNALRMIGTHSDITDRELALMFFRSTREGMVLMDRFGQIVRCNPAFHDMTDFAVDDLLRCNFGSLLFEKHHEGDVQKLMSLDSVSDMDNRELLLAGKDRQPFPIRLSIESVSNPDGSPNYLLALVNDLSDEKEKADQLWKQSNFDELTGLPNRRMMHDRLFQHLRQPTKTGNVLALFIIDVSRLRDVNNFYSHQFGDKVLKAVAVRLGECVGYNGLLARIGGDEFAYALSLTNEIKNPDQIARKLIEVFTEPVRVEGEHLYLSVSVGIAIAPNDGETTEQLFRNAEQAMYAAKQLGKSRFSYFADFMQQGAQLRHKLAKDLRLGLERHEFVLNYQPIIDLGTGSICKAEALVRWQHPEHGLISPVNFIPIAEECGVIHELGSWIFQEACRTAVRWRQAVPDFQISINTSPVQLEHDAEQGDDNQWLDYLASIGLPGCAVAIEITESVMLSERGTILEKIQAWRKQGMSISLDDFGTGYSSLSYLQRYPIDFIKIDRSFVTHIDTDESQFALCEAMIVMAHKLGMKVIAEGIETEAQREMLQRAGCDCGQGYLFLKPVPTEEFEAHLMKNHGMAHHD